MNAQRRFADTQSSPAREREGRLRVAIVGPSYPPLLGGLETHLSRLAEGLVRRNCAVEVLVQRRHIDPPLPAKSVLESGVVVRRFRSVTHSHRFPVAPGLASYLVTHGDRFDVVHGHNFHSIPASMAALVTRKPFVYSGHYHGGGHTTAARMLHRLYAPLGQRTMHHASLIICQTPQEAEQVQSDFNVKASKIHILSPGVDFSELAKAKPFATDRPVILSAGRLEPHKQIDRLIKGFADLERAADLVILGEGPEAVHLKDLVAQLRLDDRVQFRGRVSDEELRRWQRTAHVIATVSRNEAFGLIMMEGIAVGAQLLATRIPAHIDVANLVAADNVTFVDESPDPNEVRRALAACLGKNKKSLEPRVPTWDDLVSGTLGVYRDAVGDRVRN